MNTRAFPAPTLRVWVRGFIGLLVSLAFSGCQTPSASEKPPSLGWEDHRLSNYPRPYDKLLVEIDAVDGTQPSPHELAELERFLQRATNKPGGITIKLDNVIPREIARRRGPDALALEYLNGPTDNRSAFLYIFCYRSKLAGLGVKPDHPQFTYFPYPCSVFIDRSYFGFWGMFYRAELRRAILLHEVGHALGLARNPAHSKDGHCTCATCLMGSQIIFRGRRFFTFRQPWENTAFCADCQQDLEDYKAAEPKPNERLWKGYFVDANPGYQILTLPGFVYVHFGDAADLAENELSEKRRAAISDMNTSGTTFTATMNNIDPGLHAEALALLAQEKNEELRGLAKSVFEKSASLAESLIELQPDEARALASDALIDAAKNFSEIQVKLKAVRRELGSKPNGQSDGVDGVRAPEVK